MDGVALTGEQARRRFLVLVALRWLPTGLAIPVTVLLMLDRGLSPADVGVVTALQGGMVLLLELPTGGLADVVGRRPVLLGASVFALVSYALIAVAATPAMFAVAWALQGVYRALESGPLEAWFVDTAQADDPDAPIEAVLARGGVVIGVSIALGSVVSSGLVALAPIDGLDPLATPFVLAMLLLLVQMVAISRLVREPTRTARPSFVSTLHQVPRVIRRTVRVVRASRVLTALVAVEFLWGFGSPAFELLAPVKLDVVTDSATAAAELFGPMQVVGWLASAGGAALVPWTARRVGIAAAATVMLAAQAALVVALGLSTGAAGVAVGFVAVLGAHGGANAAHAGILHRAVTSADTRASVVSVNSLCAMFGGTVGGIALGALADAATVTAAIVVAAASIALASPLYLVGRQRRQRPRPAESAREYARR